MKHSEITASPYSLGHYFLFTILAITLASCGSSASLPETGTAVELLDTLFVVAPAETEEIVKPSYKGSPARSWDLKHTALDISFDWENKSVKGIATLLLIPYFYSQNEMFLDAKEMDISHVKWNNKHLYHSYENDSLRISFPKDIPRDQDVLLTISYKAFPYRNPEVSNDLRGFYFVGDSTQFGQVWTQGETEYNSHWFPTIDKPNERCTQDIKVTVPKHIKCLSNGAFKGIKSNGEESIYHYIMDQEHAPYLFLLVAGDFAVVEELWNDIELAYWVDPAYKEYAKKIFNHTPEMLEFFSNTFGYNYPWPSYRQVIVKDFVSGAMENTTAVTFGEFVQKVTGELIDDNNDDIVAHEMAHHWFGDLVTCESWSNLTLNEGFANYAEYLWREYKYDSEYAELHRYNEMNGYLREYYSGRSHPLIHYYLKDKEEMFDSHSYNKGGLVLHMLRKQIGDDAFFGALNHYLRENEYTAVELDDLRQSFEFTTGLDLQVFFEQWYLTQGHPLLTMETLYQDGKMTIAFAQNNEYIFHLPIEIDIVTNEGTIRKNLLLKDKSESISFPLNSAPLAVVPDPESSLLAEWKYDYSDEQQMTIIEADMPFRQRYLAYTQLAASEVYPEGWVDRAVKDSQSSIKSMALEYAIDSEYVLEESELRKLVSSNPDSEVRALALEVLYEQEQVEALADIKAVIKTDSSYYVLTVALQCLDELDPDLSMNYAKEYLDYPGTSLKIAAASVFASKGKKEDYPFFQNLLESLSSQDYVDFIDSYSSYLANAPTEIRDEGAIQLKTIATENTDLWKRLGGTLGLFRLINHPEVNQSDRKLFKKWLNEVISQEQSPQLKSIYLSFQTD